MTIKQEADGWYASVKVEAPIRKLEAPVSGSVIGIDVGLDNIAAMSDGSLIVNNRTRRFVRAIIMLQRAIANTADKPRKAQLYNRVARIHQKAKRHTLHTIHNDIIKPLVSVETIKLEQLTSKVGQMGSSKTSVMRTVYRMLKERYGDRVRAVDCAYTSQDCSHCGIRSKESWSYDNGPMGECVECGYRNHRDINAARNIASREPLSLDILA